MPLRIELPWHPTALRGNYLYWKNARTGETRKSYISEGQLKGIKKDLDKYRKLTSGLGHPWVPVRYEEPYIYYKSSVSGLETKSFVPPEMRGDIARFLKPSLGEPGRARVVSWTGVGKPELSYVQRGNFTALREVLSPSDRALMPYRLDKFTKRMGVVTKVLDAETLVIDNEVLVKIKRAKAPDFRKNPAEWLQAKQYLESIALNQNIEMKIDLNAPFDSQGTTIAEVNLLGERVYIPRNQTINLSLPFNPIQPNKSALFSGDIPILNYNQASGKIEVYNLSGILIKEINIPNQATGKKIGYEASIYNLMVTKGVIPSFEEIEKERIQKEIMRKAEASYFVQGLMANQTALAKAQMGNNLPSEVPKPDRPGEFGGLDWLSSYQYYYQAEAINLMHYLKYAQRAEAINLGVYQRTGEWGTAQWGQWGTAKYTDKYIAGEIFRRLYEEKLYTGRMRMRQEWGKPGEYLDVSAGFLIELGGDIAGDILTVLGYGRGIGTRVLKWGVKELPLSFKGEKAYINLRRLHGEKLAKWMTIQAAKGYKLVYTNVGGEYKWVKTTLEESKYIQKEGLRILGTNWELITQPTMQAITSPIWRGLVHYPIIQPVKYGLQGISSVARIIRDKLPLAKPIDYSAFNYILRDLRNEARSQMQSKKAELYALQMEAKSMFGKGYDTFIQMLIENEALRAQYPIFKPLVESILQRNANIASIEMAWKLLDATRSNYLLHAMTPMAREAMESGKLLLPPKSLSASGDRNVIQIMGEIINPYNIGRVYGETIEQINTWSVKAQGFPLLEEGAFNIMKIREGMHVRSVAVMSKLKEVAETFGEPLGLKIPDYAISKIPLLQGVQLPIKVIKMLEGDELIRSQIAELTRKSKLEQMLWYSDTAQRFWRFSVTFGDPSWLPNNVQSGLYVAWMYAHVDRISSYKNAWTELARKSEVLRRIFKLSQEGGVIKNVYGEAIPASQLIAEAKEAGILGVEGAADISRNYRFGVSDTLFTKIHKTASWALKNSEDVIRFPMYYDLRINKGMSVEEARSIVMHTQGNYGKSALSPFESQVMTRLTNFYVWYKLAPKVLATQFITEPRTITIPFHLMNAWNGDRGDTERQYLTDRQLTRMIFRIPGTDAYTTPAIFSLSNAVYKMGYLIKDRQRGFYWEELNRDPDLLLRFLKDETAVDWLNRGAGRVTVEANKATITYVETGDSVSVRLDSGRNKLVLMDDMTGATIKEFPLENTDGKFGIYKEVTMTDTIEKVIAEYGARTLVMPIELAVQKDFRFTSVIESPFTWAVDQFLGTIKRAKKEAFDPTIDWREKIADLVIGWYIDHLRDNPMIPRQDLTEEAVNKVIGIKVWEVERGDYFGCGA